MLIRDDLFSRLDMRREEILALLKEGDVWIFGGLIKRGWSRSDVDIAFTDDVRGDMQYAFIDLLHSVVRDCTSEHIEIMPAGIDWARRRIGVFIKRDVLGKSKIYTFAQNQVMIEVAKNALHPPQWDKIKSLSFSIAKNVKRFPEEEALRRYAAEVHAARTQVL